MARRYTPQELTIASANGGALYSGNTTIHRGRIINRINDIDYLPASPFAVSICDLAREWRTYPGKRYYIGARLNRARWHFAIHFRDAAEEVFHAIGYPIGHYHVGNLNYLIFEI